MKNKLIVGIAALSIAGAVSTAAFAQAPENSPSTTMSKGDAQSGKPVAQKMPTVKKHVVMKKHRTTKKKTKGM